MDTKGSVRQRDGAARRAVALSLALAWAAAAGGCGREPAEAVAPFGGPLASALPDRDVIGFARIRADDPRLASLLDSIGEFEPAIAVSVGGPLLHLARLAREGHLVAPGQSVALLLLDPSVHGALVGFAWRGKAAPFVERARADGLRVEGERIWLPGAARVEGVESVAQMAGNYLEEQREDGDEEGRESAPKIERPTTRYHLVERDGLCLLLPARDGAEHVAVALAATQLLDPATGDGFCARLELGGVLDQAQEEVRNHITGIASQVIWKFSSETLRRENDRDSAHDAYFAIWRVARSLIHGSLDWLIAIDHLFVREEAGRCDLYLHAESGEFFERTLDLWSPRTPDELLAGAPADARWLLAAAVEPDALRALPDWWRASRPSRRRERVELELDDAEKKPPFIDSFGGRLWLALAPPPDGPRAPSLLDLLPLGRKEAAEPTAGSRADETCARLWAELKDDENSGGLLAALLEEMVPPKLLPAVRVVALPVYSIERLGGGCVEAVGSDPATLLAAERARLGAPSSVDWELPAGAPERASLLGRFALAEREEPGWLALQRDTRGLWLSLWWPER